MVSLLKSALSGATISKQGEEEYQFVIVAFCVAEYQHPSLITPHSQDAVNLLHHNRHLHRDHPVTRNPPGISLKTPVGTNIEQYVNIAFVLALPQIREGGRCRK